MGKRLDDKFYVEITTKEGDLESYSVSFGARKVDKISDESVIDDGGGA